jgi:hypothetical protein
MKKFAVTLLLCFIAILTNAQEKVKFTIAGIDVSFEGIRTFKAIPAHNSNSYYDISYGMLTTHQISYRDEGGIFSYKKEEVLISELNLKSSFISDMNKFSRPHDGWSLLIYTKRDKKIITYFNTYLDSEEVMESNTILYMDFKTEEEAKAFVEKLKSYKK